MNKIITGLATLAIATPAMAVDDVPAKIVAREFICDVGPDPDYDPSDPTMSPIASLKLIREDVTGFTPMCAEYTGTDVPFRFIIDYVPGVTPMMRATSFTEAGCQGEESVLSPNACVVTHLIVPPVMK